VNRDLRNIIAGFAGLIIAGLLLIFVFLPPEEPPIPIQPIGEEIPDTDNGEGEEETPPLPSDFAEVNGDGLEVLDNLTLTIIKASSGTIGSQGSGSGGGGGGGGGSRDRTPPIVTGIFSRPNDTGDGWYTHPFTVTWVGEDARSGIDFCDPPTNYSGPDGSAIVLEGHCTDKAGNEGTGQVTFNYNATRFVPLLFYDLTLTPNTINAGSDITGVAKTNDTSITNVVFSWKDPSDTIVASNAKIVTIGASLRIAVDIFTAPNQGGVWSVDAHFKNTAGNDVTVLSKNFTVVSTSVNYLYSLSLDKETVKINNPITSTAGTNDSSINKVEFDWSHIETNEVVSHLKSISSGTAQDSLLPDALGQWIVDAHFNNATHDDVAIKSKLFTVIPINGGGGGGGDNRPPVAVDDTITTLVNVPVTINVLSNDFDPDGDPIFILLFTQADNGSVIDNHDGTLTYTPMENFTGQDKFTYKISDGSLESNVANVTLSVIRADGAPTANAGPDKVVDEESLVMLTGSATDDHDNLIFLWSQIAGPVPVIFTGADTLAPSFTAPSIDHDDPASLQLTLTFQLVVTDADGNTASDTVTVTVKDVNKLPLADAGSDQTIHEATQVHLSGSGSSDPDDDDLTFSWKQTGGPSIELSDATSAAPSFTAPEVSNQTVLTFELKVNDGFDGNSTDSVNITVLDEDECNGEGHDKDRHRHGEIHRHKEIDEDKHKHGDIHKHKDMSGDHDECNGGGQNDDKDQPKDKHKHNDNGNDKEEAGDNDQGGKDDNEDSEKDRSSSGGGDKERKNEHSEKGANNSGQHDNGSHDDSSDKGQRGGNDNKSGGNDNRVRDSSGEGDGGNQGSGDNGSGHKKNGNDNKGSSSSSREGERAQKSDAGDKGGKDNDRSDGDHDNKKGKQKRP
jgi:hypothetical protein